jgi:vitamin K-dependent gamma-carboxylase
MTMPTAAGIDSGMGAATEGASMKRRIGRLGAYLCEEVDGASLGLFRVSFGAIMLWEVMRYFKNGWIERYYIEPRILFSFVPFLKPWGGSGMFVHFAALGVCALLMALGLFYRLAAPLFCAGFTYVFLLEKAHYLNHFYLICLLSLLLSLTPAHRAFSLDRLRARASARGAPPETAPRAHLFLLRAQIALVYFYGGISKLNRDWLRGEPFAGELTEQGGLPILRAILSPHAQALLLSYSGLAVDLSVGFLLLSRRTFWIGAAVALLFNLANAHLFSIGIFPYLMIATLVLFPDPAWPRRLARRAREALGAPRAIADAPALPARRAVSSAELALLSGYLLLQLALPLRHFFYGGDVNWDEEGHRFSWRMKLRDKDIAELGVYATDPVTLERELVDIEAWLTDLQIAKMAARPDMLRDFARVVADDAEARTGVRPRITAEVSASLNSGPYRYLLDPEQDLAAR